MPLTKTSSRFQEQTDRSAFAKKARDCLSDQRIARYFGRNLAEPESVIQALINGEAFAQAKSRDSYAPYSYARTQLQEMIEKAEEILDNGAVNHKTVSVYIGAILLALGLLITLFIGLFATAGITLGAILCAALSGWFFGKAETEKGRRYYTVAFSFLAFSISLCAIILPYFYFALWPPFILIPSWVTALITGYLLHSPRTVDDCKGLAWYGMSKLIMPLETHEFSRRQRAWLDDCVESVIIPNAVLAINTALGEDKDRLLVEQDSEGLRKLQDPSFTVSTSTEQRIASVLSQMDGGSIALAGPRGAGKTTLLKKFSSSDSAEHINAAVSVYLTAPAEYAPRDFIAELLQRLCEEYLVHEECQMPDPIYRERKHSLKRALGRIPGIVRLILYTAIVLAVIAWMAWPIIGHVIRTHYHYHYYYISTTNSIRHWFDQLYTRVYNYIHSHLKSIWTFLAIASRIVVIIIALSSLPPLSAWRQRIGLRKEPPLAKTARDYLLRLQVEKTVTWGKNLNLNPVAGRVGATFNRGGTASYTPWTLPELVGYTRRFMEDISNTHKRWPHAVVVGIDEIDRIGSLDHAERFIGEIKAVFGVERCFFIVAVAEDIGSVFAQRATAGRSILENAFDDIVVAEPLNFEETRDLLLKRVPGFTDSFVYLTYALSGGLPRELIRVTRRLVEENQKLDSTPRHPRLEDLTFILVKQNIIESIRATRAQTSRLALNTSWAALFEILRSASTHLRSASLSSIGESRQVIEELSKLKAPKALAEQEDVNIVSQEEQNARRIIQDFSAYAYFGLTIIDAFSDKFFELQTVQQKTNSGSKDAYEELAFARNELSVSSASSRVMLARFRSSLHPRDAV